VHNTSLQAERHSALCCLKQTVNEQLKDEMSNEQLGMRNVKNLTKIGEAFQWIAATCGVITIS